MRTTQSQSSFGKPGSSAAPRFATYKEAGSLLYQQARAKSRSTGAPVITSDVPVPEAAQPEAATSARQQPLIEDNLRAESDSPFGICNAEGSSGRNGRPDYRNRRVLRDVT